MKFFILIIVTDILIFNNQSMIKGNLIKFNDDDPKPKGYVSRKITHNIEINGDLDKKEWSIAEWTEPFVDIEGKDIKTPRFETRMKMMHNDEFFYVCAHMKEPHLVATLKEKNSVIYHDNDFEVFIDPNWSSHQYTEFEMNAFNTIWSLLIINPYRDGYNIVNPYPIPGLISAVKLMGTLNDPSDIDEGWNVEIAFPWSILKQFANVSVPPKDGDIWRMNFSRVEWKYDIQDGAYVKRPNTPEDNWVWTPQWEINMHKPEMFGFVQFSSKEQGKFIFPQTRWEIQQILFFIYQSQKEYLRKYDKYAQSYSELFITEESFLKKQSLSSSTSQDIKLNLILLDQVYGYDASILLLNDKLEFTEVFHVRNDSKQWKTIQKN